MKEYVYCRTGENHRKHRQICQDVCTVQRKGSLVCVAVADGCSYARFGRIGAEIACDYAIWNMIRAFPKLQKCSTGECVQQIIIPIKEAIQEKANKLCCEVTELDCTIAVLCVEEDTGQYIYLGIGDCSAFLVEGGSTKLLSAPANGFFPGSTFTIASNVAMLSAKVFRGKCQPETGFCLMTDGFAELLANNRIRITDLSEDYLKAIALMGKIHIRKTADDACMVALLQK